MLYKSLETKLNSLLRHNIFLKYIPLYLTSSFGRLASALVLYRKDFNQLQSGDCHFKRLLARSYLVCSCI